MVELYVKLHTLQSDWNDDLFADSQPGSSSSNTPPQQSYIVNTLSRLGVQVLIRNISNQEKKIIQSQLIMRMKIIIVRRMRMKRILMMMMMNIFDR
jgi:hypothetical protein